jgi:ankyrin repeat protein
VVGCRLIIRKILDVCSHDDRDRFRWASLQLDRLCQCPLQDIESALTELPKTLDGTYERILRNINEEYQKYAHRIFQCLTVSVRPLHVKELAEVFAIRVNAEANKLPEFNVRWRPQDAEDAVLSACSTLVAIQVVDRHDARGSKVVQFSHFSVKEYLTSSRLERADDVSHYHIRLQPAHTFLAQACLCILPQLDARTDKGYIKDFLLLSYAAQYWVDHARFENVSSIIRDGIDRLFDKAKPHFAAWIWVYDFDNLRGYHMPSSHPGKPRAPPLYYAALCGLRDTVERLVGIPPQDVNTRGGNHGTPLHAAVERGHLEVAQFLLQQGADVNARNNKGATLLHLASWDGDTKVMRLLLDHGADPGVKGESNVTPLILTSRNGNMEATRTLLEHGADLSYQIQSHWTWEGQSPLARASFMGHSDVVKLLLDHGAKADEQDMSNSTPLHYALLSSHANVVRVLLDRGANVNVQAIGLYTPLHMAAANGYLQIVEHLLECGADPHIRNKNGKTPSQVASERGHHQLAELLSEHASEGT